MLAIDKLAKRLVRCRAWHWKVGMDHNQEFFDRVSSLSKDGKPQATYYSENGQSYPLNNLPDSSLPNLEDDTTLSLLLNILSEVLNEELTISGVEVLGKRWCWSVNSDNMEFFTGDSKAEALVVAFEQLQMPASKTA